MRRCHSKQSHGHGEQEGWKEGGKGSRGPGPSSPLLARDHGRAARLPEPVRLTGLGCDAAGGAWEGRTWRQTGKEMCGHFVNRDANAISCLQSGKPLCWWRLSNHRCVLSTGLIQMEVVKVKTLKCLMETPPRRLCWGESAAQMTTSLCSNRRPTH